jgi:lysozyme
MRVPAATTAHEEVSLSKNMSYGERGMALTEQFEGLKLAAYQDSVGVWTIGYGHTGADVRPGLTITLQQASDLLLKDVGSAVATVNKLVSVALTQNQFDALVDFVYNVGAGNFGSSTLLKDVNAHNYAAAAEQFLRWDKAGGMELPGLLKRRQAERALFLQADAAAQTAGSQA